MISVQPLTALACLFGCGAPRALTNPQGASVAPRTKRRFSVPGDLGGTNQPDIVARDRNGYLWLYQGGTWEKPLSPRTRIGGGWNAFSRILAVGDHDNDGRNDLMAYSPTPITYGRNVYVYKGTGDWRAPFGSRLVQSAGGEKAPLLF